MGASHLDFTTEAFLTNDDGKGTATLALGLDGVPIRVAQDVASNDTYCQVAANVPTDTSQPKFKQRADTIQSMLQAGTLVSVAGRGVWCKQADLVAVLNTLK